MTTTIDHDTVIINNVTYVRQDAVATDGDGLPYVICRSRNQGVMSGFLQSREGQECVLLNARQLWSFNCKFVLADMSVHGVSDVNKCKFSCEMPLTMTMTEVCGVYECTQQATTSIRSVPAQDCDE